MARKTPKKREGMAYKFDKSVDSGPPGYETMDKNMAETIHKHRIQRQIRSRLKLGIK